MCSNKDPVQTKGIFKRDVELNAFGSEERLEQCPVISAVYMLAVGIIEKTEKSE